jgi:hypothetical protein
MMSHQEMKGPHPAETALDSVHIVDRKPLQHDRKANSREGAAFLTNQRIELQVHDADRHAGLDLTPAARLFGKSR